MSGTSSTRLDSSKKDPNAPSSTKKSHKRKRDLDGSVVTTTPAPAKKQRKSESPEPVSKKGSKKEKRTGKSSKFTDQENPTEKESALETNGGKAVDSGADDRISKTKKKSKKDKRRSSGGDNKLAGEDTDINGVTPEAAKESKADEENPEEKEEKALRSRHSKILSKYHGSLQSKSIEEKLKSEKGADKKDTPTAEPVVAHDLEPLPQPAPAPEQHEPPRYSSLPAWLADPLRVSAEKTSKFSELGIDSKLLNILEDNGYKEAFAVQSTVIPLLLRGTQGHPGDLCISAATGSGKTLAYVLPLVTALEQIPAPRLRGLIVVPTRELVKQAREACELCAAGSGLKIGSAVGNVAMKDEQHSLMRVDRVYDPLSAETRLQTKLTGDDWTKFSLQDYISEAESFNESLPGYVNQPEPNVDVLICTPGRLVDHLRYTKGFTLRHVQWLVIDEADRLLNESFQEWVDVVMDSLDARSSPDTFGYSGKLLSGLGLPINGDEPRKVVLSATMTRDVTKLNSLRLANPKLVVIGNEDAAGVDQEDGKPGEAQYSLPPTLKEFSVSVGDGSTKPLYLLRLLLSHIRVDATSSSSNKLPDSDETNSDETSSDESSSEVSDSSTSSDDTSLDSDSESESESESSSEDEKPNRPAPAKTHPETTPYQNINTVLIFTKSSESASRLSRLLSILHPTLSTRVGTIVKSNKSSASRKTLTSYRRGKLSVIIATDRASRGLDLPSLSHVVNYDVPPSVTSYVHRVGRTARAGKEGSAWTLVAHREGRWFANEIARGSDGKITRCKNVDRVNVKLEGMDEFESRYGDALEELEQEVKLDGRPKSSLSRSKR